VKRPIFFCCPVCQDKSRETRHFSYVIRHIQLADTLFFTSNKQVFLSERHRLPDRSWEFSQDILYEVMSFPQRQVEIKSASNERAYNILNFGFMFHVKVRASCMPAFGYGSAAMKLFTATNLPQLPSAMEYQAVKYETRDFKRLLVKFVGPVFFELPDNKNCGCHLQQNTYGRR
jgi:hypothetical protein